MALRGVSVREYRGSARRARGLNSTIKNLICYLPQPLSSETIVSSVSPLYSALQNTGEKCKIYLSTQKGECFLTPSPIPCGIVGYSHTPPLRTYVRLGEKARRAGRLKQRWSDVLKDFYSPPCRVPWYYGVSPSNRGRRTNTIHRKVLPSSPVFCIAKYRGGVLWTEGLKNILSRGGISKHHTLSPYVSVKE